MHLFEKMQLFVKMQFFRKVTIFWKGHNNPKWTSAYANFIISLCLFGKIPIHSPFKPLKHPTFLSWIFIITKHYLIGRWDIVQIVILTRWINRSLVQLHSIVHVVSLVQLLVQKGTPFRKDTTLREVAILLEECNFSKKS